MQTILTEQFMVRMAYGMNSLWYKQSMLRMVYMVQTVNGTKSPDTSNTYVHQRLRSEPQFAIKPLNRIRLAQRLLVVNSISCDNSQIQSDAEFLVFFVVATEIT